jgi:hypothetical protein
MPDATQSNWFLKFGSAALLLLACCWLAPRFFTHIPQFPPTTTDQQQFVILDRYLRLPARSIALVGSSLAVRLKEEFFEHENVRNLALPGGSPLTGLALMVADTRPPPRVVVVEANVFDRSADMNLVLKVAHGNYLNTMLRPFRSLAASYQSARDFSQPKFDAEKRRAVLGAPVATHNNQKIIEETLLAWSSPGYDPSIAANTNAARTLVADLEARGTTVYFYELPVPPELENAHYVVTTRESLRRRFGSEEGQWLRLEYPAEELRWDDAIHLDERSAVLVSQLLDNAINKKLDDLHRTGTP